VLPALLVPLLVACRHSGQPTTTADGAPLANHAPPIAAHPPASDLALIPVDSDAVVGINFAQLQKSPLWKQYMTPVIANISGVTTFQELCGFDPFASLQTITLGVKGIGGSDKPTGILVIHGYDRARAMACFDANGKKQAEKAGIHVTIDGDVVMATDRDGNKFGFTFIDQTTFVAIVGPDASRKESMLRVVSGNANGLDGSPAFKEMHAKINTRDSLWMLINGTAPAVAKASSTIGIRMRALFGSINVADGLSADVRLRVATAAEAASLTQTMQGQMAQAKTFFDRIDVVSDGEDVKITATLGPQKLMQLVMTMIGGIAHP
jgi:hypothetical protein